MENKSSIKEMFDDYKIYRAKESEKISKLSEEEQLKYYTEKQTEIEELAKRDNLKTVSFSELLNGEDK